jgi:hypothetical protein
MAFTLTLAERTVAACADCAAELDHCHGSLINHDDGTVECTNSRCADLDSARHALRPSCVEFADCQCGARLPAHRVAS